MAKVNRFNVLVETQDTSVRDSVATILREEHGVHGLRLIEAAEIGQGDSTVNLSVSTAEDDTIVLSYAEASDHAIESFKKCDRKIERALSRFALQNLTLKPEDQSSREDYLNIQPYMGDRPQIEEDPNNWIEGNPLMHELIRDHPDYGNMMRFLCNERGLFLKVGNTAGQRAYWNSSLNGGLPILKKADPLHEGTFMLHDLFHFVPVDPLLGNSEGSESTKAVYLAHRLLSEATTLVLADMVGAADAKLKQKGYDTNKRKIYPVYESIQQAQGRRPDTNKLLAANAYFCFTGNTAGFESLGASHEVLVDYRKKYETIFRDDFLWNLQNYEAMDNEYRANPHFQEYYAWLKANTDLPTLDEYSPSVTTSGGEVDVQKLLNLFQTEFKAAFDYENPLDETSRVKRAYGRYFAGQRVIFARFNSTDPLMTEELRTAFDQCFTALNRTSDMEEIKSYASQMRMINDEYVGSLLASDTLLPHEAATYRFATPLYPVKFVNYEKRKDSNTAQLLESMNLFAQTNERHLERLLDVL